MTELDGYSTAKGGGNQIPPPYTDLILLFYSHALGQVTRLVDIRPTLLGNLIGQ